MGGRLCKYRFHVQFIYRQWHFYHKEEFNQSLKRSAIKEAPALLPGLSERNTCYAQQKKRQNKQ